MSKTLTANMFLPHLGLDLVRDLFSIFPMPTEGLYVLVHVDVFPLFAPFCTNIVPSSSLRHDMDGFSEPLHVGAHLSEACRSQNNQ